MAKKAQLLILPFVSALLLWCSFPPLDWGALAWVALVPLAVYLRLEPSGWRASAASYAAGYAFFVAAHFWFVHIETIVPFLFGVYNALYFLLFGWLVRLSRAPLMVSVPIAWTSLEFVRQVVPVAAFPWFFLSHTQHQAHHFIQASDLLGAPLISLLVGAVNGLFASMVLGEREALARRWSLGLGVALLGCVVYGFVRAATISESPGPRVAVVQPNIPQDVKEIVQKSKADEGTMLRYQDEVFEKHLALTRSVSGADLIVWPEAAVLYPMFHDAVRDEYILNGDHRRVWQVARDSKTMFLTGMDVWSYLPGERRPVPHNTALLFDPERGLVGRYDKIALVPFGEYVPFQSVFPWIKTLVKDYMGLGDFISARPGRDLVVFSLGRWRFGTVICFEGAMPGICRGIAGKDVDFIVNISNEGWFRDSAELDQMLAIVKFRSLENRVPLIRAMNTGISCVIDASGRVREKLVVDGRDRQVAGVLTAQVPLARTWSLYRSVGDVLGVTLVMAQLVLLGIRLRWRRS